MKNYLSLVVALLIVSISLVVLYHFIFSGSGEAEEISPVVLEVVEPAKSEGVYESIKVSEVYSSLTARDEEDRVYSGQVNTAAGLEEFKRAYKIDTNLNDIDFDNQMLIFGITDEISTRAFQFVKNAKANSYVLDYYDSGIKYKLASPGYGKKYSHVQVFVLKKIDGISHVRVKNFVAGGLSKVYE